MSQVFIIAEAGVNHNGSIDMALQLVDSARKSGADAVKFQTYKSAKLVSRYASKAEYQKAHTDASESQLAMLRKLELSVADHEKIIRYCREKDIRFMSSPFDHESLDLLANTFDLPVIKLGSGEITNAPLLLAAARTGKRLILSTGMSTLDDVEKALSVLAFGYLNQESFPVRASFQNAFASEAGKNVLQEKVMLLHCTTEYPTPYNEVNLLAMDALTQAFELPVGYSDHTQGWGMSVAAVARGAQVIEKHFTLNRNLLGPDHQASLEPDELKAMVDAIRQVEQGMGDGNKAPTASELPNMTVARKSLVAAKDVAQGERFTPHNLTVKRPGHGVSPFRYWEFLGKKASRSYVGDEVIVD